MEDGSLVALAAPQSPLKNGQVHQIMANCPVSEDEPTIKPEVNGGSDVEKNTETDSDSSAYDALVIDESVKTPKNNKPNGKRVKKHRALKTFKKTKLSVTSPKPQSPKEVLNPEETTQPDSVIADSEPKPECEPVPEEKQQLPPERPKLNHGHRKIHSKRGRGKKGNPQLREYAQYLGLQPTVQFKCVRCKVAGFETLASLNEHSMTCTATEAVQETSSSKQVAAQFKIHRKVFLCSVCGTYYENWNLFLHMREVHRRFICLYCLGMFSQPEKLCLHLVSKHNCVPGQFETVEDFYSKFKEPCVLLCCGCEKVFNEQDDFFNHDCSDSLNSAIEGVKNTYDLDVNSQVERNDSLPVNEEESRTDDVKADSETNECVKEEKNDVPSDEREEVEEINSDLVTEENNAKNQVIDENSMSNCASLEEDKSVNKNQEDSDSVNAENRVDEDENTIEDDQLSNADRRDSTESKDQDSINENDLIENGSTGNANDALELENTSDSYYKSSLEDCKTTIESENNSQDTETRKVPKVTLKLKGLQAYSEDNDNDDCDSDASDGLIMEVDNVESEPEAGNSDQAMEEQDQSVEQSEDQKESTDQINPSNQLPVAGSDIPIIELELEQPLDKFEIKALIQKCLKETVALCIYCNHARKIAVNGKQLGYHAIAEHRFSAIVNSITAEELIPESFNARIRDSIHELEDVYFSLESSSNPEEAITFSHLFECFQCRYATTVHKELYLHNRKMHAKTILLCIMCKSNFYSYSELICHLCPGVYALDSEVRFRCCMCVSDELPSAFRLMVHLRKRHHACDVCLELCNNQSRLSNHVWKHKLHHFCYRCGIAYRNKPDITKHLFWKHGTESVLCKRCLQKKWPHVYHFCIPGPTFTCEECNLSFSRAVNLMVHKRLHNNEFPHACTFQECSQKFISKKLLSKHELKHREPEEQPDEKSDQHDGKISEESIKVESNIEEEQLEKQDNEAEKAPPKVDIYDLPELNLSESDSSDSETENPPPKPPTSPLATVLDSTSTILDDNIIDIKPTVDTNNDTNDAPQILENIWENFKNYQASKEKSDFLSGENDKSQEKDEKPVLTTEELFEIVSQDHDYCARSSDEIREEIQDEKSDLDKNLDHDYCSAGKDSIKLLTEEVKVEQKVKKEDSSDSSSDSDSSSCTCGSNCSCSSSSGSSSSSSDSSGSDSSTSEGRRKKLLRKQQRKQAKQEKVISSTQNIEKPASEAQPNSTVLEVSIQESDLETTESDTDEDFYDEHPQRLAKQLLEEKRNKLLQMAQNGADTLNGSFLEVSRPSTPSLPEEMKPKKKSKSKKRKKDKKKSSKYGQESRNVADISSNHQLVEPPKISPISISFSKASPVINPMYHLPVGSPVVQNVGSQNLNHKQYSTPESETSLRASKRRRVPNKFYGYSSDEEQEKANAALPKWKKTEYPQAPPPAPMVVPPLTIKNIQPSIPPQIVEPISIRPSSHGGEYKVHNTHSAVRPLSVRPPPIEPDSASDSMESSEEEPSPPKPQQPQLYCYCRCPYDEVSEMIGCDSNDCAIEWFHFECVGIMVPPKGQWFCPDCRKRKQQNRRDNYHTQ